MLTGVSFGKIFSFKIFTNCCLLFCSIDFDLLFYCLNAAICNGKVSNGDVTLPRGRSLPVMTNGINTKTDLELFIAKEASRRGLKLSDLESRPALKGTALKDLDVLSNLASKKTSEDHNLNELDKLSLEASQKNSKGGQQNRATFSGVFGKSSKKNGTKASEKLKDFDDHHDDDVNDDSDSDSLSASSSSINNSRKNSRSNSPKVRAVFFLIEFISFFLRVTQSWSVFFSLQGHEKSQSVDLGPSLSAQLKEERLLR